MVVGERPSLMRSGKIDLRNIPHPRLPRHFMDIQALAQETADLRVNVFLTAFANRPFRFQAPVLHVRDMGIILKLCQAGKARPVRLYDGHIRKRDGRKALFRADGADAVVRCLLCRMTVKGAAILLFRRCKRSFSPVEAADRMLLLQGRGGFPQKGQ